MTNTVTWPVHEHHDIDSEWIVALGSPEQGPDGEMRMVVRVKRHYDPLQHPQVLDDLLNVDSEASALGFVREWGFLSSVGGLFTGPMRNVYREKANAIVQEAARVHCALDLNAHALKGEDALTQTLERHKALAEVKRERNPALREDVGATSVAGRVITSLLERGLKGMTYGLNPDTFRLEPRPANLLGAIYWHLYTTIIEGHELKVCQTCQHGFVPRHGNQDFCSPRHAALFRKRAQRRRKRRKRKAE